MSAVQDQLQDLLAAARHVRDCWAHDSTAGRLADAVAALSDEIDAIDFADDDSLLAIAHELLDAEPDDDGDRIIGPPFMDRLRAAVANAQDHR